MSGSARNIERAKPKRRRLRYGLRTLLVLITIASAAFAWLGVKIEAARQERLVVAKIEKRDGRVVYGHQDSWDLSASVPPGPEWLHPILGENFFAQVEHAHWRAEPNLRDEEIDQLMQLRQLKHLELHGCRTADDQLARVMQIEELEELELRSTSVSDAHIAHLADHPSLASLNLRHTAVTDVSIDVIAQLPKLDFLDVVDTQITKQGIEKLRRLRPSLDVRWAPAPSDAHRQALCALEQLGAIVYRHRPNDAEQYESFVTFRDFLANDHAAGFQHLAAMENLGGVSLRTKFYASALEHVGKLDSLRWLAIHGFCNDESLTLLDQLRFLETLELDETQITDDGLRTIAGLSNLHEIDLQGTMIDGSGLAHLQKLTRLETLSLAFTSISKENLTHLTKLPQLRSLDLSAATIGDDDLDSLAGMTQLEDLYLWRTAITDAGLAKLDGLTGLKEINVQGTAVTSAGHLKFIQALPNCAVER